MMKQDKYPKISIITPSFNQGKYIERTIKSVLVQNYQNLEYIVIDGGSTDNSLTILKKYSNKLKWISEKDEGQADAINKGIKMSTGDIIAFINSDDTYEKNALHIIGNFFRKNDIVSFVYGLGHYINERNTALNSYNSYEEYIPQESNKKSLFAGCYICQPAAFWRRRVIEKIGYFDKNLNYALDYDYWIRAERYFQFYHLSIYLANTRLHKNSKSVKDSLQAFREMADVQLKHFKKVHFGVIFNIAELDIVKNRKKGALSNAIYLMERIYKTAYYQVKYNHELPSPKMFRYYLIWIKEIFISKNSKLDKITKKILIPIKALYYMLFRRNEFINFLILNYVKPSYIELGKLSQYKPKKIDTEKFPQGATKNFYTISIVTPSYNQGKFIEKTIKSLLGQNYPKLEYCVQDGGSGDNTNVILQKYKNKITHYESKKDKGQSNAINLGFSHTTGEIMSYLNSDDVLMPGALQFVNNFFQENPDVDVIYGHRIIINQKDKQIGRWVLYKHSNNLLKMVDYVPQETLFWRRRIWDKAGGKIDESYKFAMDWDLLMRFIKANAKIVRVPYFLGMFRVHTDQKTSSQINTIGRIECQRILKKYHEKEIQENIINRVSRNYIIKSALASYLLDKGVRI